MMRISMVRFGKEDRGLDVFGPFKTVRSARLQPFLGVGRAGLTCEPEGLGKWPERRWWYFSTDP